jgi:hypothetical protein
LTDTTITLLLKTTQEKQYDLRPAKSKHARPGCPHNDPNQPDFRTNPLYGKLIVAFPQFTKTENGKPDLTISDLADYIGYHRYAVYSTVTDLARLRG